jgi:two-component system sensor histidine kinase BaeS
MTEAAAPAPAADTSSIERTRATDGGVAALWPEQVAEPAPRLLGAALAVGLLAAAVLPFRQLGIGTFAVLLASGAVVLLGSCPRRTPYLLIVSGTCLPLLAVVVVRDAVWVGALCALAAGGLAATALVDARSVAGMVASSAAVPLAAVRGMPWLVRGLCAVGRGGSLWPALRTATVSLLLVAVFGALFTSADTLFASWVDLLLPDADPAAATVRALVLLAVAGTTLAASYVALNPPPVHQLTVPGPRPVSQAFEWLVPVGLVLVLYAGFVAAQLTVMFGGHTYLRRTTGVTYAEHVHQGFGQMTVATALTLAVVVASARVAPRASARDRLLLRGVLGALCALTLVVVASALFRMHVYEQAYGFTRLRVLVSVFEAWLGLVVVLVMASGVRLSGRWVPRAAVLSGAAALLALSAANPDGYVAERNVERYLETGKVDWYYLGGLSADAVPALLRLPEQAQACVLHTRPARAGDDLLAWNLGRARAGVVEVGRQPCVYR